MWKFQKLPSYTFYGGNFVRVLVHRFFTAAHFYLMMADDVMATFCRISHFLTASAKFSFCSFNKEMSPFFRWPVAYVLFFLCLSLYSKFVNMKINLSLILQTTRIQKQFLLSVFVFIDSLVVSVGGYAIPRQNNLELHFGCYTRWLSYFTLVCLWCGRAVGRSVGRSNVRPRDSQMDRLPHFLSYGATLARAELL